jgi:hypothetical protein
LIQYVLNIGQLLEQALHNEDHVGPFVDAGGFTSLFAMYTANMGRGWNFLAQVSPLSSVAVSTLHHSTVEDSLNLAFKCVFLKHAPEKVVEGISQEARKALRDLETTRADLGMSDDDDNMLALLPKIIDLTDLSDAAPKERH